MEVEQKCDVFSKIRLASQSGYLHVNCERCVFLTEVVCWFGHGYRLLFVVVVMKSSSYLWLRILSPVG